jgi:hypothetical protein
LRMALARSGDGMISADKINSITKVADPDGGLEVKDILDVVKAYGCEAQLIEADELKTSQYLSALAAIVESGGRALFVFTVGKRPDGGTLKEGDSADDEEHVVLVLGHSCQTDEWHPIALPTYSGSGDAPYYPASEWIDHFLIHDDNFGPYFTLSSRAFDMDGKVAAKRIIAIQKLQTNLAGHFVEALASDNLYDLLPRLEERAEDRWLQRIAHGNPRFVLRSLLVERAAYLDHLRSVKGHDGSFMGPGDLEKLEFLPPYFWVVEFSLPSLFTGNHSKLGEVLIAPNYDGPKDPASFKAQQPLAVRVPGFLVFIKAEKADPMDADVVTVGLGSHAPILRLGQSNQAW